MKYICRPLTQDPALAAMFPDADPDTFFLDIETTGLRADDSFVYLIGTARFERSENGDGVWMYHAWFGQDLLDEQKILRAFLSFAGECVSCITFSGKRFDLTYLSRCMREYYLDTAPFDRLNFEDYVTLLRPLQDLFSVSRQRLFEWEARVDRKREDRGCFLSGNEMSALYLKTSAPFPEEVIETLSLHNRCDLQSLVLFLRLLSYRKIAEQPIEFSVSQADGSVTLTGSLLTPVPIPVVRFTEDYECRIEGRKVRITVYESNTDCRLYFPDYRNYYFVPSENGAIHKDLAALLPKAMCVKATPETCYQTVTGSFLPLPLIPVSAGRSSSCDSEDTFTILKRSLDATCGYVRACDAYLDLSAYGREFLRRILQSA